jgi:hypothetical protein
LIERLGKYTKFEIISLFIATCLCHPLGRMEYWNAGISNVGGFRCRVSGVRGVGADY